MTKRTSARKHNIRNGALQEYWQSYYQGLYMKEGGKYVKLEFMPLPKRGTFDLEKI
jgi:hypothetical protein